MGEREVIIQCHSVVKIPCAATGDTRTQLWSKEWGKLKEEEDQKTRTKNKTVKISPIKDGTNRLFRNVGNKLPLIAA
jgi:hypothetical protein